jgi:all-trans-retinol 13,14-reductase
MGFFGNFQRSLALGTLFINEKPQIGTVSLAVGILLFLLASALLWRSRRVYYEKLPSYKEIPATILSHMASKKELEGLSPDVVVIGSGVGSLASACLLAKAGYKVVVFEQHYIAGGSTHMFKRDHDFEFDVGVHYVGGCMDRCWSPFRIIFDFLSDGKLEWSRMSENYDVAYNYSTGEQIEISGDPKRNRKTLLMHFPHLKASALDTYYRKCRLARFVGLFNFALKGFPPQVMKFVWNLGYGTLFRKVCLRTTMDVMKQDCGLPDDVIGYVKSGVFRVV